MTPRCYFGSAACAFALVTGVTLEAAASDAEQAPRAFRMGVYLGLGRLVANRRADSAEGPLSAESQHTPVQAAIDAEWYLGRFGVGPRLSGMSSASYAGLDLTFQVSAPLVDVDRAGARLALGFGPATANIFEPFSFGVQREQGIPFGWCGWFALEAIAPGEDRVQPSLTVRLDARSVGFSERMMNADGRVETGQATVTSLGVFVLGGLSF